MCDVAGPLMQPAAPDGSDGARGIEDPEKLYSKCIRYSNVKLFCLVVEP